MKYKLSIIGSMIVLSMTACKGGSSDMSLDNFSKGSSVANYMLAGEIAPIMGVSEDIRICVDMNNDLKCTNKDIISQSNNGEFKIEDPDSKLLKNPVVIYSNLAARYGVKNTTAVTDLINNSQAFRLISPSANYYPDGARLTVSPLSTLVYALMNNIDTPLSFSQATKKLTSILSKQFVQQISSLQKISFDNDLEKQHFQHFNLNFIQFLAELEQAKQFEKTLPILANYVDEIIAVFSANDDKAIKLLKIKIKQQQQHVLGINDTGVMQYLVDGKLQPVPSEEYPEQDAAYGLDKLGTKGFKLVKLDSQGNKLPDDASQWSCTQDQNTGLIWEVKRDDPTSPRDKNRLFAIKASGYEPNQFDIALATCTQEGSGHNCNTEEYANYLNKQKLCGKTSWRLPTLNEQYDLLDLGSKDENVDLGMISGMNVKYFPNMIVGEWGVGWYWNSSRAATFYTNAHFIGLDQLDESLGQTDLGNLSLCDVAEINGMACTDGQVLPARMVTK